MWKKKDQKSYFFSNSDFSNLDAMGGEKVCLFFIVFFKQKSLDFLIWLPPSYFWKVISIFPEIKVFWSPGTSCRICMFF